MLESLGIRLRRRREEQAVTLVTIAEQTKIKLSLLEGLERDDVSHWPAGIFRRAFVRAYAHAIGLDPDVVVSEFLTAHPDPAERVDTVATVDTGSGAAWLAAGPPTRMRYLVGSAMGALSRLRRHPTGEHRASATAPAVSTVETTADSAPFSPDFASVAHLCTELSRVDSPRDAQPLLKEAARILDAIGVIVWLWNEPAAELRPALVHGYSAKVLAQMPPVKRDGDNATSVAFRSAQTRAISSGDHTSGAIVVPLLTAAGCAGVLAIELQHGTEQTRSVLAVATILAALLAQVAGRFRLA